MTLFPGDILLYRVEPGAPLFDRLIGWGESKIGDQRGSYNYYHVAFVSADPAQVYSSEPPRIGLFPVPDPLPPHIEVYRFKAGVSSPGIDRVFEYANSRLGKPYDFLGVLTCGFIEIGRLEFCSKFTEDCWVQYPYTLAPDIEFPTPDDIATSLLLERVS